MDKSGIGEEIRTRRLLLHITQSQLAEALGVTRGTVSNWERGSAMPRATVERIHETIRQLAQVRR